jgi:hypothetical protein
VKKTLIPIKQGEGYKPFNEGYLLTVGDFKLPEDFWI